MTSIILESTITSLEEALDRTSQDDKFIFVLIDRVEEVVHDTQSLLMIKRRRPDIDNDISPSGEQDLLGYLSRLMVNLNTGASKTDRSTRKTIRNTIKYIQTLN